MGASGERRPAGPGTRLVFDVDVVAGNEHTSKHFAPGLWALLDRIPRDLWPALLRGDCGFGNEPIMREAEQRGLAYLFKLRLTANVKRMIERLATQREWTNAGQGWQAKESLLRLDGWSRQRRVIILRRRVKGALTMSSNETLGQQTLSFVEVGADADVYEYSVLATSLDEELVSFGQLYRDRGDSENIFDELKNQWGGWLRNAGPCSLPASRAPRRAVLRLVEHLRSSGRAGPAYGGYHQSAIALACHCHAGAACETNNDNCGEFTRPGDSRREGAPRRRHFSTRTRKNCGAVDGPATLAANPRESLPSFPSGPSVAFAPTPRAQLTHNRRSSQAISRPSNANCRF